MNPMRSVILLAVLWVSGSLLFAAENSATRSEAEPAAAAPAAAAEEAAAAPSEVGEGEAAPPVDGEIAEDAEAATQVATQGAQAAEAEDEDPEPESASAADRGSSPQRFVPSEQVRADFDVSFPIDI